MIRLINRKLATQCLLCSNETDPKFNKQQWKALFVQQYQIQQVSHIGSRLLVGKLRNGDGQMTKSSLHSIAGSITAGCFSTVIGHPLDTIKVHQQTNHRLSKVNSLHVARGLAKGDTLRLFKGMGAPMVNQIIMNSVMFSVFHNAKRVANESPMLDENSAALLAGLFSGFATACISTPTDWVKIQAQISLSESGQRLRIQRRTDVVSILSGLFKKDGQFRIIHATRTLYGGHVANLGREGVFTMVYLGLYDRIANKIKDRRKYDDYTHGPNSNLSMGTVVMISSFTGACAWICNYPFDTVKSIIQAGSGHDKMTTRSAIISIYESGGLKAFWRGAGSSTLRAVLVTSSRMLAYEKTIQLLS